MSGVLKTSLLGTFSGRQMAENRSQRSTGQRLWVTTFCFQLYSSGETEPLEPRRPQTAARKGPTSVSLLILCGPFQLSQALTRGSNKKERSLNHEYLIDGYMTTGTLPRSELSMED